MDCSRCGTTNRPGARFCDACGASLAPAPPETAVARKVVTVVFADLAGSTALHERLDAESVRRVMDGYYRTLHAAVDAHGGTVVKLLGDGVMAAFGVPRVAEDDALRAVRAAVEMQRAFRRLAGEQRETLGRLGLRIGVNTGEVVVRGDRDDVVGDPVNVAARLQEAAHDGDVLVGEATRRLVGELVTLEPFGDLALKGRSETVAAHRVRSLDRPTGPAAVPFVGREAEVRRLLAVYDGALAARAARLAVVLGSPGLGKSRLVGEIARRLGDQATVLLAHCDAAAGATFAPLAAALRAHLRVEATAGAETARAAVAAALADDPERARIAAGIAALLAGTPAEPEETFFVVRRFLAALAAVRPVVLVVDDVQWAEPLLLDLAEHLVQWTADAPLLLLLAARPELRELRTSLAAPARLVAEVVTLGGLDAAAATRLAASVIGADALPAAVAGRVLATSEGNPLFVGELVRMLVEDGALVREGDRWTAGAGLASVEMPPTIHALLAARVERLLPAARAVLERAAVVGRQFSRSAVAHLLPPDLAGGLDAHLDALRQSELVEADAGRFLGEPALRFHHVLVRDAAYRRLLKGTRATLHASVADWVAAQSAGAGEHDEAIGWHLEQAHQHLRELGPLDAAGRALGERASRHLAAAGRRALGRDDVSLAANLLGRALDRLEPGDPVRGELALDWCEALLAAGDVVGGGRAVAELGRIANGSERLRAWHACFAGQLAALTDPQALHATADAVSAAAEVLARAGDAAGEAKAHAVAAAVLGRLGRFGACETALDRALAAARRARDRRRANAVLAGAPQAALWGPSPVARASGRCLDVVRVLRITQGAPAVEAVALRCQAVLEALRGRTDAARRMIVTSRRMVEELGIGQRLLEADVFAGMIELLDGEAVAAERLLRSAYEGLREQGLRIDAAQAAALLGRALLATGRAPEAEAASHESESLAGDDLKAASAWRAVRAEALALRGDHAAAVELARAAVDVVAGTDALLDHADARRSLAVALRGAGRTADAEAEAARAVELWEAKGATLLALRERGRPAGAGPAIDGAARFPRGDAAGAPDDPFANAAIRAQADLDRRVRERDRDGVLAAFAPDFRLVDRRPAGDVHLTGPAFRDRLLTTPDAELRSAPIATRDERLALFRVRVTGRDGTGGDMAEEHLWLLEQDAAGRIATLTVFDGNALDDAHAALDAAHGAGEAAAHPETVVAMTGFIRAFTARDWDGVAALLAPDVVLHDHRLLGWEPLRGRAAWLEGLRSLTDLAPDARLRVAHARTSRRGWLCALTWVGTRDGGAFESPSVYVIELDPGGLLRRIDQYDVDRADAALARFVELAAAPGALRIENAATRLAARLHAAWEARDFGAFAALLPPGFRRIDRRRCLRLELDRDAYLSMIRPQFDMPTSRARWAPLATRGDRLALVRMGWEGTDALVGPSEIGFLAVLEVERPDALGVAVLFDADDLDAAHAELDDRYDAGEAAAYGHGPTTRAFRRALATRDWAALAALLAPGLVVHDHRPLGWEPLHGPAAYVAALRSLVDLAPDVQLRLDHVLAMSARRVLYGPTWVGTRDGGAFEEPSLMVGELDASGQIARFDQYDVSQLDEARARFGAGDARILDIPPNAATRAIERWQRLSVAGEWAALEELFAPSLTFDDRRRGIRATGDRDALLASIRMVVEAGTQVTRTTLATSGSRLCLQRVRFGAGPEAPPFEVELLSVTEVDAAGRIVASVSFDPEDRRAASAEMFRRFLRSPEAAAIPAQAHDAWWAIHDRDLQRMRAALRADFVFHDHRRTGVGRLEGREAYMGSVAALLDQTTAVTSETVYAIDQAPHGFLAMARSYGTLRDGGSFESLFLRVMAFRDGFAALELFEPDDLESARACFERWRAGPAADAALRSEVLGTLGNRVAVERLVRSGATADGGSRGAELLRVTEADAAGRPLASITFAPEDRPAAFAEANARFAAGEAAGCPAQRAFAAQAAAMARDDWEAVRDGFAPGAVVVDHRSLGVLGTLTADEWIASARALNAMAPDTYGDTCRIHAWNARGRVTTLRLHGSIPGGGPSERVYVCLGLVTDGRIVRYELFDATEVDRALARFAELCAEDGDRIAR